MFSLQHHHYAVKKKSLHPKFQSTKLTVLFEFREYFADLLVVVGPFGTGEFGQMLFCCQRTLRVDDQTVKYHLEVEAGV